MKPEAVAFLVEHAGVDPHEGRSPDGGASEAAAGHLTLTRATELLGLDAGEVRALVSRGELAAVTVRGELMFPRWQFEGAKPLPHLRAILAALPEDLHSLELEGWLTSTAPELEVGDVVLSPRDWLASGGDPEVVLALARDVDLL